MAVKVTRRALEGEQRARTVDQRPARPAGPEPDAPGSVQEKVAWQEKRLKVGDRHIDLSAHTAFGTLCTPLGLAVMEAVDNAPPDHVFDGASVVADGQQIPPDQVSATVRALMDSGHFAAGAVAGSVVIDRAAFANQLALLDCLKYGSTVYEQHFDPELTPENVGRFAVLADSQLWSTLMKPGLRDRQVRYANKSAAYNAALASGLAVVVSKKTRLATGALGPLRATLARYADGSQRDTAQPDTKGAVTDNAAPVDLSAHTAFGSLCVPLGLTIVDEIAEDPLRSVDAIIKAIVDSGKGTAQDSRSALASLISDRLIDNAETPPGSVRLSVQRFANQLALLKYLKHNQSSRKVAREQLTADNIGRYALLADPELWMLLRQRGTGERQLRLRGSGRPAAYEQARATGLIRDSGRHVQLQGGALGPLEARLRGLLQAAEAAEASDRAAVPAPTANAVITQLSGDAGDLRETGAVGRSGLSFLKMEEMANRPSLIFFGRIATNGRTRDRFVRAILDIRDPESTVAAHLLPSSRSVTNANKLLREHVTELHDILRSFPGSRADRSRAQQAASHRAKHEWTPVYPSAECVSLLSALLSRPRQLHAALLVTRPGHVRGGEAREWTTANLAAETGNDRSTMVAQLRIMERAGIIRRSGDNWAFVHGSLAPVRAWTADLVNYLDHPA